MAKTLLNITQEILTVMTSDEVNSITDTAEAEAVARIVVSTFESMVSNRNWPSHKRPITLESPSSTLQPTHISLPSNVKELVSISYNKAKLGDDKLRYDTVKWKEPDEFLMYTNSRNSTKTNVQTVEDDTGIKFLILNDCHPTYYTTFNDKTMVFDSFESDVDDTLHPDNFQTIGYIMPKAQLKDGWVPDLPKEAIATLVEEAKSTARFQIDSVQDIKAERLARKNDRWLARKSWSVNGGIKYPDYGRKSRKRSRDTTFRRDN